MRRIFYFAAFLSLAGMLQSCVFENDMDYPYVKGVITVFEVEEQNTVSIDPASRTISVVLNEKADIGKVKVNRIEINEEVGAVFADGKPEYLDLTSPASLIVRTYQDYCWTVTATQPVERHIDCENMSSEPLINPSERTIMLYLLPRQSLTSVKINDIKLEAEGSEIVSTTGYVVKDGHVVEETQPWVSPMTINCTLQRTIKVLHRGQEIEWTLTAIHREPGMKIISVNAWCYHADIVAEFDGEGSPVIQYRKSSDAAWNDAEDTAVNSTSLKTTLNGLEAGTEYVARVLNGEDASSEFSFMTETPDQIENMDFDDWYEKKTGLAMTYYPGVSFETKVWDSANEGTNVIQSINPTTPEENFLAVSGEGKKAARLESKSYMKKFAAGNLYTGDFVGIVSGEGGLGAQLKWGTPFTARPKTLRGFYSYAPKVIDNSPDDPSFIGQVDKCQILVMLTDWDEEYLVDTPNNKFVDQENDPHIIAYAKYESDKDTGGKYEPFELVLDYRRPDATPKYAVIVACASYLGDYFIGGLGSTMYVDEFEFVYE